MLILTFGICVANGGVISVFFIVFLLRSPVGVICIQIFLNSNADEIHDGANLELYYR